MPAKNVPDVVLKLIETYRKNRKEGESFNEWVRRSQQEMGGEGLHGEVAVAGRAIQ